MAIGSQCMPPSVTGLTARQPQLQYSFRPEPERARCPHKQTREIMGWSVTTVDGISVDACLSLSVGIIMNEFMCACLSTKPIRIRIRMPTCRRRRRHRRRRRRLITYSLPEGALSRHLEEARGTTRCLEYLLRMECGVCSMEYGVWSMDSRAATGARCTSNISILRAPYAGEGEEQAISEIYHRQDTSYQ